MSGLISRQAAIDLFPNDALEWDTKGGYVAPHLARRMIEELPFVQSDNGYSDGFTDGYKRGLTDSQSEIVRCKDCKHKPYPSDNYDYDNDDCVFEIIFPDYRCPCRCEDEYYNRIPDDDWFCGNAERKTDEHIIE